MSIATTWYVRGREATGLTAVPSPLGQAFTMSWGVANPALFGTLPWAEPEYPALLIFQLGFTITSGATPSNRNINLYIEGVGHAEWQSTGVQIASQVRRWEFGVGYNQATPLTSNTFRECLPRGWMLQPRPGVLATLGISIVPPLSGDTFGAITIRGHLLFP